MKLRLKRLAFVAASGLMLVGCSWLSQAARPGRAPLNDQPPADARTLRPGPGPVTVEAVATTSARVIWSSPWTGDSVVWYGPTSDLRQPRATVPTIGQAVTLSGLKPETRYFFRVETQSKLGVARSSVLSFKTR